MHDTNCARCWFCVAHPLPTPAMATYEEKVDEALEHFSFFDEDGSGKIDFDELKGCLFYLGIKKTDAELRALIDGCGGYAWKNVFLPYAPRLTNHRPSMTATEKSTPKSS